MGKRSAEDGMLEYSNIFRLERGESAKKTERVGSDIEKSRE